MIVSDLAINRSTTVIVLLFLLFFGGIVSYFTLPREPEPEIVIPFVSVTVTYLGVAPEDMESSVTIPIENKLTGISGVKKLTSYTVEGASSLIVEFESDMDMDQAFRKVKDKVDMAKSDLPDDADDPIVRELNSAERPIIHVSLKGPVSIAELSDHARDLEDRLESLRGVLDVEIIGDVEREIRIEPDPFKLAAYGISMEEIIRLVQSENLNIPAGAAEVGEGKYIVRVPGELEQPHAFNDLALREYGQSVVYLRDVATIHDGYKEETSRARLNGEPSVSLLISKRAGESALAIAADIRESLTEFTAELPTGVVAEITLDQSERIATMISELENSILTGLMLVLVVMFLFLGFSNALFVSLAIPLSLLITFGTMKFLGMSLNMVTLFSLMVALGMLVDNGIVVVENIYRYRQDGWDRVEASKRGAAEVAIPIIASTLTTIAAFFPMFFWPGLMGKFMSLLPKTLTIALTASLFVGLVVNPALASRFMGTPKKRAEGKVEHHPVLFVYEKILRWCLRWRAVTMTAAVMGMVLITSVYISDFTYEFLPVPEAEQAFLSVEGPEGMSLDTTDGLVAQVEAIAAPEREYTKRILAYAGTTGPDSTGQPPSAESSAQGQTSHLGQVTLHFPPLSESKRKPSAIIAELREALAGITGADVRIDTFAMGPPAGAPVNVEVLGEDFMVIRRIVDDVIARIRDTPGMVDLQTNLKTGKPEMRVVVDRDRAKLAGLSTTQIGMAIQTAINGREAGEYREGDDEYDITVRFPKAFREDFSNIKAMSVTNNLGQVIPLDAVARLEPAAGLGSITRINRNRTVTVSAEAAGRPGTEVLADVQERLADMPLPPGYSIRFTGENEDVADAVVFLSGAFVVALFLIAMILITQFNSIIQPLIILSSVVLSLAGVFVGLLIFDMPFSVMMTGIGCISLAGVVVNNAIVLVDFVNSAKARSIPTDEAIVQAGMTRFRPVFLTAITTILGLLPLGFGVSFDFQKLRLITGGDMSQFWGPMAVAIIFGLALATLMTLIVVPVLYSLLDSMTGAFGRTRQTPAASEPAPAK